MKKHLLSFKIFFTAFVAFALLGFSTAKAATYTVSISGPTNTTIVAGTNFTITATLGGGANRVTFYTYNGTTYTTIN